MDDLASRLRTAHRGTYQDESARITWLTPEADPSDPSPAADQASCVLTSDELASPAPIDDREWVKREHTCYFEPWRIVTSAGRSWWKFGEGIFITREGLQPHEAQEEVRACEPDLFELTVLEQDRRWPVEQPDDAYCRTLEVDGEVYVALIDTRPTDPAREIVRHWARREFDALLQAALGAPVLLADRASDPREDEMLSQFSFTESLAGRSNGRFFVYRGVLYQAPNRWEPPEVLEWIEVKRGVQEEADPDLVETWGSSVDECYAELAKWAESTIESNESHAKYRALLAESETAASTFATPVRECIPRDVRVAVWRRDEGQCRQCGSQERLEYDHVLPVSKGGSNTERNIQLLCQDCNRRKAANI